MRYIFAFVAITMSFPVNAATPVYTENFDQYSPNQVPWNGSGVWSTGNSVDLVASGSLSLTCVGGSGNCVDLSGSTPGALSRMIDLTAGLYSLTFQYTGNQLDDNPPGTFRLVSSINVTLNGVTNTITPLSNSGAVFQTFTSTYEVLTGGPVTLAFSQNGGGDQFRGSIIDSISIAAVPEPATWALMLLGFGVVGKSVKSDRIHLFFFGKYIIANTSYFNFVFVQTLELSGC